ncbi:MAG: hypothetical protein D6675_04560 [Gemmatimonadetes bacterium]|nr:MAG: hypothetical protein D6675_04560 [Gemmatimonadota bacterium]
MISFNYDLKEINTKIVYYGPGLCGKTTNLQYVHANIPENTREKMISLATKTDRTLFFDFLPMKLGNIGGYNTRFHLYTVPGQVFYNSTRKVVLTGVDGIVFVADSQAHRLEANIESFENLEENLREKDIDIKDIPLVLQYNKRDCPNILSVEKLNSALNTNNYPYYEAIAITGAGVFETLKGISQLMLNEFYKRGSFAKLGIEPRRKPRRKDERDDTNIWESGIDDNLIKSVPPNEATTKTSTMVSVPDNLPQMSDDPLVPKLEEEPAASPATSIPDLPTLDAPTDLPGLEPPQTTPAMEPETNQSTKLTTTLDLPGMNTPNTPSGTQPKTETPAPTVKEVRKRINVPIKIALDKLPQRLKLEITLDIELT